MGGWLSSADTSSTQVPLHLLDGHGGQFNMEQPSSFTKMLYRDCIARVQAGKVRQLDLESQTSKGKLQQRANQPLHVLFSNWATAEETEEAAYRTAGNTDIKPSLLNSCQLFYYTTDPYWMIINFM